MFQDIPNKLRVHVIILALMVGDRYPPPQFKGWGLNKKSCKQGDFKSPPLHRGESLSSPQISDAGEMLSIEEGEGCKTFLKEDAFLKFPGCFLEILFSQRKTILRKKVSFSPPLAHPPLTFCKEALLSWTQTFSYQTFCERPGMSGISPQEIHGFYKSGDLADISRLLALWLLFLSCFFCMWQLLSWGHCRFVCDLPHIQSWPQHGIATAIARAFSLRIASEIMEAKPYLQRNVPSATTTTESLIWWIIRCYI